MNIGSGMIAAPIAGLAGLGAAAGRKLGLTSAEPGNVVEDVGSALTYQPRTAGGQSVTNAITYPFAKLAQGGNYVGEKTSELTGSPALGAAANTLIQAAPAVLARGKLGRVGAKASPLSAAARAENYVARNTALDWNSLSDAVKRRLIDVAKDAKSLEQLDPKALERQARLESLRVPINQATRGQLTRDPVQLRNEGNLSATTAGKPLQEIYSAQNRGIIDNLGALKKRQKSAAQTPEQIGQSVQGAARAKLDAQKQTVSDLYKTARDAGELQGSVTIEPVKAVIETSPDLTHLGWVESWLKKTASRDRPVALNELEDLRQAAVAKAMNGGADGYYAGKVIRAIDEATEGAGGDAYKSARAARKAQAMEFEERGGVARLVEDKSRTDRATALEDTWRKTVLAGSIQDLRNVKRTLLTGGNSATRTAGRTAWRDLRAQTLEFIQNEATKSVTRTQDGTPNVTPASMERALKAVGPDKLEEIFGPGTVKELNNIMEATRDLKTEPPTGFKGSPTFANMLAFLEKSIGKVPLIGDTTTGVIRGVAQLREIGKSGREVRQAQETPLGIGEKSSQRAQQSADARQQLKKTTPYLPASIGRRENR